MTEPRSAESSILNILSTLLAVGFTLFASVFGLYFYWFRGPLSTDREAWGQFGDFVGGTLNPLFAFLSLIALVLTVSMQRRQLEIARQELANSKEELEATRLELKKSAEAQRDASLSLQDQAKASAISTRLAALTAALSVIDDMIKSARALAMDGDETALKQLKEQRMTLLADLFKITGEQLHGTAP